MSRVVGATIGLMLLTGMVLAQPGPSDQPPRWGRERVETVIIGKFATELDLTPEQAERFFPLFRQFQNEAESLVRQQHERRAEMDMLSHDPAADKGRVDNLLTQQMESERRISDLKRKLLTDVGMFLTPQQVSKCSILLDELPRKVHQFIEERKGRHEGRGSEHDRQRGRRD